MEPSYRTKSLINFSSIWLFYGSCIAIYILIFWLTGDNSKRIFLAAVLVSLWSFFLFRRLLPLDRHHVDNWYYSLGMLGVAVFFLGGSEDLEDRGKSLDFDSKVKEIAAISQQTQDYLDDIEHQNKLLSALQLEHKDAKSALELWYHDLRSGVIPSVFNGELTAEDELKSNSGTFRDLLGTLYTQKEPYDGVAVGNWLDEPVSKIELVSGLADYYESLGKASLRCEKVKSLPFTQVVKFPESFLDACYKVGDLRGQVDIGIMWRKELRRIETNLSLISKNFEKLSELKEFASLSINPLAVKALQGRLEELRKLQIKDDFLGIKKEVGYDRLLKLKDQVTNNRLMLKQTCDDATSFLFSEDALQPKSAFEIRLSACPKTSEIDVEAFEPKIATAESALLWYIQFGWHYLAIMLLGSKLARDPS